MRQNSSPKTNIKSNIQHTNFDFPLFLNFLSVSKKISKEKFNSLHNNIKNNKQLIIQEYKYLISQTHIAETWKEFKFSLQ